MQQPVSGRGGNVAPTTPDGIESCDICQDSMPTRQEDIAISSVRETAENGCSGCAVLDTVLTPYFAAYGLTDDCKWSFSDSEGTLSIEVFHTTGQSHQHDFTSSNHLESDTLESDPIANSMMLGSLWAEMEQVTRLKLWTITENTCPWVSLKATSAISMDTGSDEALMNLQLWLQDCTESHELCNRPSRSTRLPTRVIEILGPRSIRLRNTTHEWGKDVCLSHCWGAVSFITTKKATLQERCEKISWDDLPKTFQDAIDVTYRLGVQFIWIDSLCILQDDAEDWVREANKMCDVYSQAYLTIAATKSKDSNGGCYTTSDARTGQTHWFVNDENEAYNVHIREPLPHINNFTLAEDEDACFPLLTRAWIFQERNLSARMVHLGPNELMWECMTKKTCECSEWPEPVVGGLKTFFEKTYMTMDTIPTGTTGTAMVSPMAWKWCRVVEQYTTKRLTYKMDIFPALSGVAKFLRRDCQYVAGLWNDDSLLPDLLWHVRERNPDYDQGVQMYRMDLGSRPHQYCAPTWSWASVTKPVAFSIQFDAPTRTLASVLDIRTTLEGLDPFGRITSGSLRLKGRCVTAELVQDEYKPNFPALKIVGHHDMRIGAPRLDWHAVAVDGFYPDYDITALHGRTVLVMEMLRWRETTTRKACATCLVFICADAPDTCVSDRKHFERIGYVDMGKRTDMMYVASYGQEMILDVV